MIGPLSTSEKNTSIQGIKMAKQKFVPGSILRIKLQDGSYVYGRLLKLPYAAFYDYRTGEPVSDLQEIVAKPVLFIIAVHKSIFTKKEWEIIGKLPLEQHLTKPIEHFIQDPLDFRQCQIIDDEGNIRNATLEECKGLERAAVWEPEHIEDRLLDHFHRRPNPWVESLKLKLK